MGIFQINIETDVVKPLMKRSHLDLNIIQTYRLVSNLTFSKINLKSWFYSA